MNSTDIAQNLVSQLKQLIGDDSLWSINDIANYMKLSKSTISCRIISHSDFPASIQIPYGLGSKTEKRWYPNEVKAWIARHRSR